MTERHYRGNSWCLRKTQVDGKIHSLSLMPISTSWGEGPEHANSTQIRPDQDSKPGHSCCVRCKVLHHYAIVRMMNMFKNYSKSTIFWNDMTFSGQKESNTATTPDMCCYYTRHTNLHSDVWGSVLTLNYCTSFTFIKQFWLHVL